MANPYKIRPLVDNDWPKFVCFAEEHFGFSHITEKSFNEHWFKTKQGDGWVARVLEDENKKIRGVMMAIVVKGRFAGEIVPLAWISSGAVDEEARKRGAGAFFYFWIYQSFPLVGAMSGNEFSTPINATLGLDIPGVTMERFIAIHRQRTADLCLVKNQKEVLEAMSRRPAIPSSRLQFFLSEQVPKDYEGLWHRVRDRYLCCVERDKSYLLWRYHQVPFVKYWFLEIRSRSALEALAVLRFQKTPVGEVCRVVDFISEKQASTDAWISVQEAAQEKGILFTDFMMIGKDQEEALCQAGFQKVSSHKKLEAIPHLLSPVEHRQWSNTFHLGGRLAKRNQSWRRADAVYFTKGDSDRDWPTSFDLKGGPSIDNTLHHRP